MLQNKLKNKNIILASGSPRRHELLKELGVNFTIKVKDVEETYNPNLKGAEITNYLCKFNCLKIVGSWISLSFANTGIIQSFFRLVRLTSFVFASIKGFPSLCFGGNLSLPLEDCTLPSANKGCL